MRTTKHVATVLALILFGAQAPGVVPPAQAADLAPAQAGPGTVYTYGDVVRRGLSVANGTFLIRQDGCWVAQIPMVNTTDDDRDVTVVFRWVDGRGRPLADVAALSAAELPAGDATTFVTEGCSGAVARSYGFLASQRPLRIISSR